MVNLAWNQEHEIAVVKPNQNYRGSNFQNEGEDTELRNVFKVGLNISQER